MTRIVAGLWVVLAAGPLWAQGGALESALLRKFESYNKLDVDQARAIVKEASEKALALKESDPEKGLESLRLASRRIDAVKLLPYQDRKALDELVKPLVKELRDNLLQKRRVAAIASPVGFRDYLELVAPDMRNPGRTGPDRWEPALFSGNTPQAHLGKLKKVATDRITEEIRSEDKGNDPKTNVWIQVFGGFYVYDLNANHTVFLKNREFFEHVLLRFAKDYANADPRVRASDIAAEFARVANSERLRKEVGSGLFFLRGVAGASPIPGVPEDKEQDFFEYAADQLTRKGMPVTADRIYDRAMLDALPGFRLFHFSAMHRSLLLLDVKGVGSSTLYGEILRSETKAVLETEFPAGYPEQDYNRALQFVFGQLR